MRATVDRIKEKVIALGIQPLYLDLGENISLPDRKTSEKLAAFLAHVFASTKA